MTELSGAVIASSKTDTASGAASQLEADRDDVFDEVPDSGGEYQID